MRIHATWAGLVAIQKNTMITHIINCRCITPVWQSKKTDQAFERLIRSVVHMRLDLFCRSTGSIASMIDLRSSVV